NEEADYDHMVSWKTYPERLEENGIAWKIYQNELSVEGGFPGEYDSWMANFGDNPIEYFSQFNVKLSNRYINYLEKAAKKLPDEIEALEKQSPTDQKEIAELKKQIAQKRAAFKKVIQDKDIYTRDKYDKLSAKEKALHEKAFVINNGDPDFYQLTTLKYDDNGVSREINVPTGDVFHQFRKDVETGKLPTVSWLVAPENYSDHPSAAWFGAWYLSECMDILTKNPEVWKKTIFVLTYDENDGYFDHQPPFVSPDPRNSSTGKVSPSIDPSSEFVTMDQEKKRNYTQKNLRENSIGLGYRVPMVIASPWSRGGWVNSEIFDHSSSLRFLENFLEKKTGKKISETNITSWRKSICGDLTSVFRTNKNEASAKPAPLKKNSFIESVHKSKFKGLPSGYKKFTADELAMMEKNTKSSLLPAQEPGTRPSCALPYELYVDGRLSSDKKSFEINMQAGNKAFGKRSAGAPFTVYTPGLFQNEKMLNRAYAVAAGEQVYDQWLISDFDSGLYHLRVYGPNGFYREFKGRKTATALNITSSYKRNRLSSKILTGDLQVSISNPAIFAQTVEIKDLSYNSGTVTRSIDADSSSVAILELKNSHGWYHFSVRLEGDQDFLAIYAGRVENGKAGISDPAMGGENALV
ncbi:MAG: alkaline phosphatase family protein, partial [Chitinophagaceae bacterium]